MLSTTSLRAGGHPRRPGAALAVLLALLLLGGCGGDGPSPASTGETAETSTSSPAQTSTTAAVTTTSAGEVDTEAVLKRRDAPPAGVARQAEFFIGGGAECPEGPSGRPSIQIYSEDREGPLVELPSVAMICFYNFSIDAPLDTELRYPDGSVERQRLDGLAGPDGQGFPLVRLPGDPLGRHTVLGRQGGDQAVLDFEVVRAQRPKLRLLSPMDLQPGAYIRVAVGGFEPDQPVQLHLYRRDEDAGQGPFRYQTAITVQTDATGAAVRLLPTALDDPPGCYGIQVDAQVTTADGFCLRQREPGGSPGTVLVILASKPTEEEARAELLRLQHRNPLRLDGLVLEPSSSYPLLNPGLWIVHLPFSDVEQANRVLRDIRGAAPGAYAKQATPP
jgi:hypothetical protein